MSNVYKSYDGICTDMKSEKIKRFSLTIHSSFLFPSSIIYNNHTVIGQSQIEHIVA